MAGEVSRERLTLVSFRVRLSREFSRLPQVHTDHNAPCLPLNIFRKHCFQFLLGITVVATEIEDNGFKFFSCGGGGGVGGLKVHYGLCKNGEWRACLRAIAPFSPCALPLT